jgi:hypothetical protein
MTIDGERHPGGGALERFLATLAFGLAILVEKSHGEPADSCDRQQRRRGQEDELCLPGCPIQFRSF